MDNNKINISDTLDEKDRFDEFTRYVDVMLKDFENLDKIDRNDLYELVYARKKAEQLLSQCEDNSITSENLHQIIDKLQLVYDAVTASKFEEICDRNLKSVGKINKAKYGDKGAFKGLTDSGNKVADNTFSLKYYLKKQSKCLIILILTLLISSNADKIIDKAFGITQYTVDTFAEVLDDDVEASQESEQQEITKDALTNNEYRPNIERVNTVTKMISLVTTMVAILCILFFTITTIIDLGYLSIPAFRYVVDNGSEDGYKIVSSEAITASEYLMHPVLVDKEIDNNDRFEVARALVNNMINNPNIEMAVKLKADDILRKIELAKGKDVIENLVDGEMLYIEYTDC